MEQRHKSGSYILSISIIGALFFIFGFVTWLNSVLIPFLQISCGLTNFQALFVAFAFYISYTVMAPGASFLLKATGFKKGMSLGLLIMSLGALVFIPAAYKRTFWLFLTGLFIQGAGLTVLQTASNPYITIIGPVESAARRISIMGICNKVAGALSPLILGAIVLSDIKPLTIKLELVAGEDKLALLNELAGRVVMPYVIMALVLAALAAMVRYSPLPDIDTDGPASEEEMGAKQGKKSIFDFPYLIFGFIALFFYVGAEVIAGDTIIRYGMSLNLGQHYLNIPLLGNINITEPRFFTSYTLIAMVIGYIIGIIAIPRYLSQSKALAIFTGIGILLSLGASLTIGFTSVLFVAMMGFSNSIIWPAIWPLAIKGLGSFTKAGSSLLIMAIAGGALLPLLYGKLADIYGYRQAYWVMLPCYVIILLYALCGHKIKSYKYSREKR